MTQRIWNISSGERIMKCTSGQENIARFVKCVSFYTQTILQKQWILITGFLIRVNVKDPHKEINFG